MIDWHGYARGLAAFTSSDGGALGAPDGAGLDADAIASRVAAWPTFQNTPYAVSPLPLLTSDAAWRAHAALIERYVAILERVVERYRASAEVRAYIGLTPDEEALALLDSGLARSVAVARIDGYLRAEDGSLRILENNADAPAGTLFTPRLNAFVDELSGARLAAAGVTLRPFPLDGGDAILDWFRGAYRTWSGRAGVPRIAILQETGKANVESREMAAAFSAAGVPAVMCDPGEIVVEDGAARGPDGSPVDVVWNKINTVGWRRYAAARPEVVRRWHEIVARKLCLHLNPFSARFVIESKRSLALLHEERFAALFDAGERAFLADVLPWATKLEADKRVDFGGARSDLRALLLAQRHRFVLKEPYDIRGDGVTVGRSCDQPVWAERVERGFAEGHIVQEYVAPLKLPIVVPHNGTVAPMNVSLDSFVFDGRCVGLGSKASFNDRVNLFQGGQKLAVRSSG